MPFSTRIAFITALALSTALSLSACTPGDTDPDKPEGAKPITTGPAAPPGAPEGTCWSHEYTPAVIETVTERIVIQPAQIGADGKVISQPVHRLVTSRKIVKERKEIWIETPCDDQMTPEFIASVQRALSVRGLYRGSATGRMDRRTRRAILRFQTPMGIESGTLSIDAARKLGLISVKRDKG